MHHFTIQEALESLSKQELPFQEIFQHGSMVLEFYKPVGEDLQTLHSRDEIYIIAEGSAVFFHEGKRKDVGKGDFLFVKTGDEHRFETFSKDFSTWVIFYGPEGGEKVKGIK